MFASTTPIVPLSVDVCECPRLSWSATLFEFINNFGNSVMCDVCLGMFPVEVHRNLAIAS